MKTYLNIPTVKSSFLKAILIILMGFNFSPAIHGQEKKVFNHDYLLPSKGKSMVELYSGLPYVAIGQYAYGFSDRFSVGILYGYTPFVKGYGFRVKAVIAQPSESFRINLKAPFIYYPNMEPGDGDSWMLLWPAVNGELKFKNGSRMWAGVGLIGAACTDLLFGEEEHDEPHHPVDPSMPPKEEEMELNSVFNTFQLGYSKPLSDKLSFVAEVAPVMEGFKLKSPNGFLDAVPVIVTLGMSFTF